MSELAVSRATAAPIGRDAVAAFGDAVGDHNPVHFDADFAARAGLPNTVVHGPLTTAIVLDLLVSQLGADRILNLDLRLRGPVFPGDRLSISPIDYGGGSHGVEVHNQDGELVATAITILEGDVDA